MLTWPTRNGQMKMVISVACTFAGGRYCGGGLAHKPQCMWSATTEVNLSTTAPGLAGKCVSEIGIERFPLAREAAVARAASRTKAGGHKIPR